MSCDSDDADERFVALVQREHRGLTAASVLIIGDRAQAEEIVQDVLERTYVRWSKVSGLDRPGAWVRRAVINQSISAARRSGNERRAVARLRRGRSTLQEEPAASVDEIWSAVRELPSDQCTAVALHYGADLSLVAVAEEMGTTDSAVKSLLHRARTTLRRNDMFEEMS